VGQRYDALDPRIARRHNPIWTETELAQVSYALAIAAIHEAMHNKVESVKEDDWELHRHGGGNAAMPLARRSLEKRPPPSVEKSAPPRTLFRFAPPPIRSSVVTDRATAASGLLPRMS